MAKTPSNMHRPASVMVYNNLTSRPKIAYFRRVDSSDLRFVKYKHTIPTSEEKLFRKQTANLQTKADETWATTQVGK